MLDTVVCDQIEEIFISCVGGVIVGLVVFGGICICVFKKRYCCY